MLQAKYSTDNFTAVILGGAGGIGQALAKILVEVGAEVFIIDIKIPAVCIGTRFFEVSGTDKSGLQNIANQIEKVDGLVNLAGHISQFKSIMNHDDDSWNDVFDTSFKSCLYASQVFEPLLQKSDYPAIVNMSSGLGNGGQKNYGPYSAAKATINSLTKTLATELAPKIRVNGVAPGAVDTEFIRQADGSTRFDVDMYNSITPQGRMATAKDIADLIMFLLSKQSDHIVGQTIHINGGAFMRD